MLSAIIRESVEKFIQSSPPDCHQTIKALTEQCEKTVDCIKNEKLSQECIDNFLTELKSMRTIFKKLSNHLRDFEKNGCANDDQFALFFDIIEDFLPYSIYIAIRSSNWELRISALKIMAPRFMRSGAVTYKWLVLIHLADFKSYPSKKIERMRSGGWVSDGRGVTLARDEFHERKANKIIQLILPKLLTEKNMQVLCQYVTCGASARRNLIHQFFPVKEEQGSIKSKSYTPSWPGIQEKYSNIFRRMISPERPFKNVAKDGERLQILGRSNHGEERKNLGEDLVKSYVKIIFCAKLHNVSSKRIPMQKKILILFPSKKEKTISK